MSYATVFGLLMMIALLGMLIYSLRAIYKQGKSKGRTEALKDVNEAIKKKDKELLNRTLHPRADDFGRVRKPDATWGLSRKT